MNIYFFDEYNTNIYNSTDVEFPVVPVAGDAVNFGQEDWVVKHRIFHYPRGIVIIHLTQELGKPAKVKEDSGRQNDLRRSILELANKQQATDKKVRAVTEQTAVIRKHINQQIVKERKHDS
jgi:hypothetical protein